MSKKIEQASAADRGGITADIKEEAHEVPFESRRMLMQKWWARDGGSSRRVCSRTVIGSESMIEILRSFRPSSNPTDRSTRAGSEATRLGPPVKLPEARSLPVKLRT